MVVKKPDFSGWATKNDLKCADGLTIRAGAFAHNDRNKVPLVWQHSHGDPKSVLGHAVLKNMDEGVYTFGYFNQTENGQHAKKMVNNRDIEALSIYANNLRKNGMDVMHGDIKEVSLVLAGANPGAFIDQITLAHGNLSDDEGIIYTGEFLEHKDSSDVSQKGDDDEKELTKEKEDKKMATSNKEKTVQDVFDSMTEDQKNVLYYLVGKAIEENESDSDTDDDDDEVKQSGLSSDEFLAHLDSRLAEGFTHMTRNVFDQTEGPSESRGNHLSHAQIQTILEDAKQTGSLKESFLSHAEAYGIQNIDVLFPDAKSLTSSPDFVKRRTEWVADVVGTAKHSPFSRIKSTVADITAEEARARGYVKNTMKKNEVIELLKRTTSPTTVYKKQKLDRDDIVDITDLDIVSFIKAEMRVMLDEELARAILLGDGRDSDESDKIKDPTGSSDGTGIRSIINDADMYTHKVVVNKALTSDTIVETVLRARTHYKGTGTPNFYTTDGVLTDLLLAKDKMGRRLYDSMDDLAAAMRVGKIIPVEVMEFYPTVIGIVVNMADYTIGADKGGQVSMFDDFDIDWNQHKYLLETRVSGALTKPKSAIALFRTEAQEVVPIMPGFNSETNRITIPSLTGVDYMIDADLVEDYYDMTETTTVEAYPQEGYVFPNNVTTSWTFTYTDDEG